MQALPNSQSVCSLAGDAVEASSLRGTAYLIEKEAVDVSCTGCARGSLHAYRVVPVIDFCDRHRQRLFAIERHPCRSPNFQLFGHTIPKMHRLYAFDGYDGRRIQRTRDGGSGGWVKPENMRRTMGR